MSQAPSAPCASASAPIRLWCLDTVANTAAPPSTRPWKLSANAGNILLLRIGPLWRNPEQRTRGGTVRLLTRTGRADVTERDRSHPDAATRQLSGDADFHRGPSGHP